MAIINGLYIHVTDESAEREVMATSHPVEEGVPTTDTVKAKGLTIALSGKLVGYGNMTAAQVLSKLRAWQSTGALLDYHGRNIASSLQIRAFDTSHPNTNHGGADFNMVLTQARIAKSAYVPKTEPDKEKEEAAKEDVEITVGCTVVFKGGPVYVASDAQKPSSTRSRSTCKCTIISTRDWSVHQYHLISTDGGRVYGWVDKESIEGVVATSTSGTTNAGQQQVKSTSTKTTTTDKYPVYHKVKKGDTVFALCSQYSYLTPQPHTSSVVSQNSSAFSRPGDPYTLKIGAYLLMGYK